MQDQGRRCRKQGVQLEKKENPSTHSRGEGEMVACGTPLARVWGEGEVEDKRNK